jgi:threonine/homoserine/homoserine lactone efflux protein
MGTDNTWVPTTTAALQLVDPKSWLMALTVSTVFAASAAAASPSPALGLALLALLFLLISALHGVVGGDGLGGATLVAVDARHGEI